MSKQGLLFKYKDLLPVTAKTPMFTLGEGDTPLVRAPRWRRSSAAPSSILNSRAATPPVPSKTAAW